MSDRKTLLSKIGVLAGSLLLFALLTFPIYLFMTSGAKKVTTNADGTQTVEDVKPSSNKVKENSGEGSSEDIFPDDDFSSVPAGELQIPGDKPKESVSNSNSKTGQGEGGFDAGKANVKNGYRLSPVRFWIGFAAILILYIVFFEVVLKKQFYYFMKDNPARTEGDEENLLTSGPNYGSYLAALLPFLVFLLGEAVLITWIPNRITKGLAPFLGLPWEIAYVLLGIFVFYTLIAVWVDSNYNHILYLDDEPFCYCKFGHGEKNLVLITGLNLMTLRGKGLNLAYFYRQFMKDYTVYVFDKKDEVPEDVTVEDLAEDIVTAMKRIGLEKADVVGVSQGGMIAQYMAINHPDMVEKLVLCVTAARVNDTIRKYINRCIVIAKSGEMEKITTESFAAEYTPEYQKKIGPFVPLLSKIGIPKSNTRFIRLAKACLTVDTYDKLDQITCPVFVIAAKKDKTVSCEGTEEIAEKLGCQKYTYSKYAHFVFNEAPDFNDRILKFLKKRAPRKAESAPEAEKTMEELEAEFEESLKE